MSHEEIAENVINWAADKGILDHSTPLKQLEKTQEELNETKEMLEKLNELEKDQQQEKFFFAENGEAEQVIDELKKEIGDQIVTLILVSELVGLSSTECLEAAYNKIKSRTGHMSNGVFVKESA